MKIGLVSLGCPKNLVDSEVMLGLAREAGHEITPDTAAADVLVVNTCAFVEGAKQESIDAILEMANAKNGARAPRLVVTGCLAERYREELRQEIPEIDAVLGTGEVASIVEAIEGRGAGVPARMTMFRRAADGSAAPAVLKGIAARHREAAAAGTLPTYIYEASTPRVQTTPRHFAYVKVAEGCDYNCSFCIIPVLRGQYRSRAVEDVVDEARRLAERGVKELILISQDTTFYGTDRKERGALARLLGQLSAVDGLEWIRMLYLYPTTITDEVIDVMRASEKVCRYIDLPLQHSAASVLQRMRRPGSGAVYERLLSRIRERLPGVTLRTTLIVGFPGETEEEFEHLVAFLGRVEFDHVGVFTYSHEEGTAAYGLRDDVPAAIKAKRRDRLMKLQRRIVERRQTRLIGSRARVLVDGPSPEHDLIVQGRLAGQAPEIDPVCYFTEVDPSSLVPGSLIDGEIVDARGYDLIVRPDQGPGGAAAPVPQRP